MRENYKIGFIGAGNMAQAILYGMVDSKLIAGSNIYAYDILPSMLDKVAARASIHAAASNAEVIEKCDMVVLVVKPYYCEDVLREVGKLLCGKALLSIVTSWSFRDIKALVADTCRVQAVQPNTPLLVGAGMTTFARTTDFTEEELAIAHEIFGTLGLVETMPDDLMTICGTACGAVPAWAYMFIEALADGCVQDGLPRDKSYRMCAQAVLGAAKMVLESGLHPGALKDQITSPNGSTIRGIHALERGGMRGAAMDAVKACNDRWRK